ncbi:uncharacterized protein RCO7_01415 [Rhynchosporium graminicola]|uniref:Uncharacterized protein n=1 Tax=Rhynchosporium graminicola TaxID=2792576 RepID=A0A1E1JZ56_9HELO|nr:uncharacterized protein RCO7_01415 [Rhynchosporium commune]
MTSQPPQNPSPPPVYKPFTLHFQQSPLGSHPLPDLPPPPPSYKRSPSPTPSTTSQPSLHELPKYTPRAPVTSSSTTISPTPKAQPDSGLTTWAAWNPLNWISASASQRNHFTTVRRQRDPMAGRVGTDLDACEQYDIEQRESREAKGDAGGEVARDISMMNINFEQYHIDDDD